jgi:hypothetical protein
VAWSLSAMGFVSQPAARAAHVDPPEALRHE